MRIWATVALIYISVVVQAFRGAELLTSQEGRLDNSKDRQTLQLEAESKPNDSAAVRRLIEYDQIMSNLHDYYANAEKLRSFVDTKAIPGVTPWLSKTLPFESMEVLAVARSWATLAATDVKSLKNVVYSAVQGTGHGRGSIRRVGVLAGNWETGADGEHIQGLFYYRRPDVVYTCFMAFVKGVDPQLDERMRTWCQG